MLEAVQTQAVRQRAGPNETFRYTTGLYSIPLAALYCTAPFRPLKIMSSLPLSRDVSTILSPEATIALRDAFRRHLADRSEEAASGVGAALGTVCNEARREQIPAERLLVAFKGIWSSLPEVRKLPPHEAADEVRNLVSLCIERYYAPE